MQWEAVITASPREQTEEPALLPGVQGESWNREEGPPDRSHSPGGILPGQSMQPGSGGKEEALLPSPTCFASSLISFQGLHWPSPPACGNQGTQRSVFGAQSRARVVKRSGLERGLKQKLLAYPSSVFQIPLRHLIPRNPQGNLKACELLSRIHPLF